MKRLPWKAGRSYPIFVAGAHKEEWIRDGSDVQTPGLADHFRYNAAKREGNAKAALQVVQSVTDKLYMTKMKMRLAQLEASGIKDPVLVAPYKRHSNNRIARTAAFYMGDQLGLDVDTNIVEQPCESLTGMDKLQRMFNIPTFAGEVEQGRFYIGVDDAVSSGTTMASMRSHIEEQGGKFLMGCALSSPNGESMLLNATETQVQRVVKSLGDDIVRWFEKTTKLPLAGLTSVEAKFLQQRDTRSTLAQLARVTS